MTEDDMTKCDEYGNAVFNVPDLFSSAVDVGRVNYFAISCVPPKETQAHPLFPKTQILGICTFFELGEVSILENLCVTETKVRILVFYMTPEAL